jgi:hypothetical protein
VSSRQGWECDEDAGAGMGATQPCFSMQFLALRQRSIARTSSQSAERQRGCRKVLPTRETGPPTLEGLRQRAGVRWVQDGDRNRSRFACEF